MYGQGLNPLPDVQAMATGENRVFLEYFWGSEGVYGLGISGDTLVFNRLGRSDSIGHLINQLVDHFHAVHASTSQEAFTSFVTSSHALYDILIEPFEPLLANASLQIIPDGAVNLVPFDILIRKVPAKTTVDYRSLDYLLKSRAIGYAYSTAMVRAAGRRSVRNPSMLAVGFTGGMRERSDIDLEALQEIEGAEKELDALSSRFSDGKFLRDQEATESNFKSLSPGYDIIHLAIHGRGDRSNGFSASLFFRSKYDSTDDGIFHAYEVYGLKLKAIMAVLSACESGIGKDYRGEGMISMASAFTSAGCENTLMSLWKVNDQASITLMDDFYQQLLNGLPIDQALRTAKLNYLSHADEITADPKTWAPLVAYGSLHQVFETDGRRPYLILVLAGGVLIAAGAFYMRRQGGRRYRLGGSRSPL
jgi:CHAT domain-containing protein